MNRKIYSGMALISPVWTSMAQFAVSRYEGWGQWAAAPLLVLPLLYGCVIGMTGLVLLYSAWRQQLPFGWWLGWALVALYPAWLVLLRQL